MNLATRTSLQRSRASEWGRPSPTQYAWLGGGREQNSRHHSGQAQGILDDNLGLQTGTVSRLAPIVFLEVLDLDTAATADEVFSVTRTHWVTTTTPACWLQQSRWNITEVYRNRKGYFSLNVQVVGGPTLEVLDIVARWPGWTHDQVIFKNLTLHFQFKTNKMGDNILLGFISSVLVHNISEMLADIHLQIREKKQDEDFIKEGLRDEMLTPIILTINPDDSSDSESDSERS
ncbi:Harbinger transposase-derived nuclease domain [Cinara cedri]|uniref:Harbinger transposase-derived nuclease domain n=1 Tax=Cinara cedri TaxID=506608 RepID=A0A5E4MC15_9HEMI|nr:Harbinger transposase-derived nuclease domain [Cinara cedri]